VTDAADLADGPWQHACRAGRRGDAGDGSAAAGGEGVLESAIAWITAASLIAGFANFLVAPVLDWRLSRRAYAIILALLSGLLSLATLLWTDDLVLLAVLALSLTMATYLNQAAVGGWLSSITGTGG
jgi:hypothetical protein